MAKSYTLDKILIEPSRLTYNHVEQDEEGNPLYYVARITFRLRGLNGGASKELDDTVNLGSGRATPFTNKEIYTSLKNTFGNEVATCLNNLYKDLIDEDLNN